MVLASRPTIRAGTSALATYLRYSSIERHSGPFPPSYGVADVSLSSSSSSSSSSMTSISCGSPLYLSYFSLRSFSKVFSLNVCWKLYIVSHIYRLDV
eukprot:3860409-Amphidinium_carterae.1